MRKHDTRTHTLKDGTLTGKSARAVRCEKVAAAAARYKSKTKNKIKNKIKNKNNRRRNKTKIKPKRKTNKTLTCTSMARANTFKDGTLTAKARSTMSESSNVVARYKNNKKIRKRKQKNLTK